MHILHFTHCMEACCLQFLCAVARCVHSHLYAFTFFFFSVVQRSLWVKTSVSVTLFTWSYMFCIFLHVQLFFFLCVHDFLLFPGDSGWVCFCHFLHHQSKVVLWERGKNRDSVRGGIQECGHSLVASRVSLLQCAFLHRPLFCSCLKLLVLYKICSGMP